MWIKTSNVILNSEKIIGYGVSKTDFQSKYSVYATPIEAATVTLWSGSKKKCDSILNFIYDSLLCNAAGIDLVKFVEAHSVD